MTNQPEALDYATVEPVELPDIQARLDAPDIALQSAGICGLRLPLRILDIDGHSWHSVVQAQAGVAVPERVRGTHMSRFISFLEERRADGLNLGELDELIDSLLTRLEARAGSLEMRFTCFIPKRAPVSGMRGSLDVEAGYQISADATGATSLAQWLTVPVMTLCPCSKAISEFGAHNQRTLVTLRLEGGETQAIGTLAALIESCASSPLYPILKRADEKHVTERSYENPRFVEDVARAVYQRIAERCLDTHINVRVESQESIHNHQAYAVVEGDVPGRHAAQC